MDEPFCFLIVRMANITKNICGSHIPTHVGIVPLAIKLFVNILEHK
jgi:ABC-type methionine transport system permease subunit